MGLLLWPPRPCGGHGEGAGWASPVQVPPHYPPQALLPLRVGVPESCPRGREEAGAGSGETISVNGPLSLPPASGAALAGGRQPIGEGP